MTQKITTKRTIIRDQAHLELVVNETVAAQIDREKRTAKRDAEIQEITEKHSPKIDALSAEIENNMVILEQWADAHSATWGDARSIVVGGNRLGFRTGNPAVKPVGKLTFKAIIASIAKAGGDLAKKFLKQKTDLCKETILATARQLESTDEATRIAAQAELDAIGCHIEQAETFYLDPAREGQADTLLTTKS